MNWKDVSSYSQSDTDRSPRTYELHAERIRITVTRWIHGDKDKWYLMCFEAGMISPRELTATEHVKAQQEALRIVTASFKQDLQTLLNLYGAEEAERKENS